jgi:HK97 family phage portal protein
MVATSILFGGAGARIIRNEDGRPIRLKKMVGKPQLYEGTDDLLYFRFSGETGLIPSDDVLYLPGLMSTDGLNGRGIVAMFLETFGEGIAAQMFGQKFFANGAHLKGYLSHPDKLEDKAFTRLKEDWKASYEGMENVGKTAILEEGMEFKALTVSPKDSQYIDVKKNIVEEVSRITRVPLHMLASLDRSTFNNIEVMGLEFVKYTLMPWLTKIEQESNRKLFYTAEMGDHYCEHNLNGLLRADSKSRAEFYKSLFYLGALTPNQILKFENINTYAEGDEYYVQRNTIPATRLNEVLDSEIANKNTKDNGAKDA